MHYTLLVRESAEAFALPHDPDTREALAREVAAYLDLLRTAGVYVSGAEFQEPVTATSLVPDVDGSWRVHDGPCLETKEQLGGLIILSVIDRDDALRWARLCPLVPSHVLELRPSVVRQWQ